MFKSDQKVDARSIKATMAALGAQAMPVSKDERMAQALQSLHSYETMQKLEMMKTSGYFWLKKN